MASSKVKMPSVEAFVTEQSRLLCMEREAELAQAEAELLGVGGRNADSDDDTVGKLLEARGVGLRGLVLASSPRSGMFGRTVITLEPRPGVNKELPAHNISNGDIVGLYLSRGSSEQILSAVITAVHSNSISLSTDGDGDKSSSLSDQEQYKIVKLANDVTYRRLKGALKSLETNSGILSNCLFGISTPSPPLQSLDPKIIFSPTNEIAFGNERLDASQKEAVRFALLQKELAVIHGPPGTGKTTTVVEIISLCVRAGQKVLCTAPSNVAVDNLLERLVKARVRSVRLGHPARVHQDMQRYSLDALISTSDQTKIVQDVRRDLDKILCKLRTCKSRGERASLQKESRTLRKEAVERERDAIAHVLKAADVVIATMTSAGPDGPLKHLPENHFDVVVIDECSQAMELACWIPIPFAKKVILAGDHRQLPPTIISEEAARAGLAYTLMERVIDTWGAEVVRMLTTQYRMNEVIMTWSSEAMYDGQLQAHASVKTHLLKDLAGINDLHPENTNAPLVLIDTSGCDFFEAKTEDEISKANEGEVALVCIHTEQLIKSGLDPKDIAVITPYNLQVELIRLQLLGKYPSLEVRSVDGFQGREKEAVVLSLVRSNATGEVGFLAESRRLNVAVTRARRHVAVICDTDTVQHDAFLKALVGYMQKHGDVRSAMQYENELAAMTVSRPAGMELELQDGKRAENTRQATEGKKKKAAVARPKEGQKPQSQAAQGKERKEISPGEQEPLKPKSIGNEEDNALNNERRDELMKQISDFLKSPKSKLAFAASLNSHDRLLIHQIAEELDLLHESTGEGKERHIVVEKKVAPKVQAANKSSETEDGDEKLPSSAAGKPQSNTVTCSGCQNSVPRENIELHKLRCSRSSSVANASIAKTDSSKKKKPVKSTNLADEEDLDKLLASFSRLDKVCQFSGCRTKTSVLGVTCAFCNVRFCLGHGQPEVHGCGDEARKAARQQISRDAKLYAGSGRPSTKPDAVKRTQMKSKLDKKLDQMSSERKPKRPDKK